MPERRRNSFSLYADLGMLSATNPHFLLLHYVFIRYFLFALCFNVNMVVFQQQQLLPSKGGNSKRINQPTVIVNKPRNGKKIVQARDISMELFRARGIWPFDFYPDELIIEEKRIIIKRCDFPFTTTEYTIPIERLTQFTPTHSLIFSSIYITGWQIDTTFQWLAREEAEHAKELVDGLLLKEREVIMIEEEDKQKVVQT